MLRIRLRETELKVLAKVTQTNQLRIFGNNETVHRAEEGGSGVLRST
jgi:hypothetical protein